MNMRFSTNLVRILINHPVVCIPTLVVSFTDFDFEATVSSYDLEFIILFSRFELKTLFFLI